MPCRVGITTDPETRKKYWEGQVYGLTGWRILNSYPTKEQAQAHEERHAVSFGCQAHAGGPQTSGTWHVYKFEYTRVK